MNGDFESRNDEFLMEIMSDELSGICSTSIILPLALKKFAFYLMIFAIKSQR